MNDPILTPEHQAAIDEAVEHAKEQEQPYGETAELEDEQELDFEASPVVEEL